jgi:lipopolysaccharide assembly outer membrane protein LptD (OstA)
MSKYYSLPEVTRNALHRVLGPKRPSGISRLYVVILLTTFTNISFALSQGDLSRPVARAIASCGATPGPLHVDSIPGLDGSTKVKIQADEIEYPERNIAHLRGFVELVRGGHRLYADELIYDRSETRAVAKGAVKFQSAEGDVILTSILRYYIATGKFVSGYANFVIANRDNTQSISNDGTIDSYGTASRITLLAGNMMYLENAEITSCRDGKEHTVFTASELRVDLDEGIRTAKHVKIRIAPPDRLDQIQEMVK